MIVSHTHSRVLKWNKLTVLLLLLCLGSLSACALIVGRPMEQVLLQPEMPSARHNGFEKLAVQLAVTLPTSGQELEADRIVLLFKSREVRFLSTAKWTNTTPIMLQRLLVHSLEGTGYFAGVAADSGGIQPDYRLTSDLRFFHVVYDQDVSELNASSTPTVHMEQMFTLNAIGSGRILAGTIFSASVPVTEGTLPNILTAYEQVSAQILQQATDWTIQEITKQEQEKRLVK